MSDLEQKIHALNEELNRVHTIDAAGLWQRMEKKRHRERRWTYGLQIAAGLFILVSIAAGIWMSNHREPNLTNLPLPAEAQRFVQDYESEIAEKLKHIDAGKIDTSAWQEIQLELQLLEHYGQDIRQDMNLYDREQMMELLKRYYERKIRLIELLQKEMFNTEKKAENHES